MTLVVNAGPNRIDPSRTLTLRRQLSGIISRQFASIRAELYRLVVDEDAFGLRRASALPSSVDGVFNAEPGRFAFASSDAKVREFGSWIEQQYRLKVRSDENDEVWRKFIEKSFKKGAGRAYDDFMKNRKERGVDDKRKLDFYAGGRDEFLRSGFANPMQIDRLKILAARTYTDIQGATEESATKMRRALVEGLAQGKGPREIADRMSKELSVAKWRTLRIARTEIVRAHAEGQLNAFEKLGVGKVGAKVEWQITRLANGQPDPRVCELCGSMAGKVFKIKDARGRIPAHPNCRCAWLPVIEEAGKEGKPKPRPRRKPAKKKAPPAKPPARRDEPAKPTPGGRPKAKRPAPKKPTPKRKDDRDGLNRLEITFGKKKIVVRPGRPIGKPKAKSKTRGKAKTRKERVREDRKVNRPKPARTKTGKTVKKRGAIQRRRITRNVYCPTGPGGGVDPTCKRFDSQTIRDAIDRYSQLSYESINSVMRGDKRFKAVARADAEREIAILSEAFRDPKIVKTTAKTEIVHRGIGDAKVFKSLSKLKEGDTFVDKAFVSTSRDWQIAASAAEEKSQDQVIMRVLLPKGAKYVKARSDEKEILLPSNTKFKILKSDKVAPGYGLRNSILYLDVEVMGEPKKRPTRNALHAPFDPRRSWGEELVEFSRVLLGVVS